VRLLVTGATGFLGRELVPRLLKAGHQVYSLSRHGPLVGDITQYNLGLKRAPRVDAIIHLAALVSFRETDRKALFQMNSAGTLNVISFCRRHQVPWLIHVSTAYICGDARGLWGEGDFHRHQRFRNAYEQSKFWGEAYVREAAHQGVLRATILRPAILVGRSTDGVATAFEGFYGPLRALLAVQGFAERTLHLPPRRAVERWLHLPPLPLDIKIRGDPLGTLNLVPVDWAAQKMVALLEARPGTYHLTNPSPPTNQVVAREVAQGLGIQRFEFRVRPRHDPLSDLYNRLIRPFSPYLWGEPVFASSVAQDFPKLDLGRIIAWWRDHAGEHREAAGAAAAEADGGPDGGPHREAAGQGDRAPAGPVPEWDPATAQQAT